MWKVLGGSVTGTSHQAIGTDCQDASGWQADQEVTCLAVADGAGSRHKSRSGAELAVQRALLVASACAGRADANDPATWFPLVLKDVREHIADLALAEGEDASAYATTLAVATITSRTVCIAQVGDTIAVLGCAGQYRTVDPAAHPEYVNETSFVTDADALDQLRITVERGTDVDAVFLSTDGLRFKVLGDLSTGVPFSPFFEDLNAYVRSTQASTEEIERFLSALEDQSGDDKSLIAAVRI
jgi:hypothetical protein